MNAMQVVTYFRLLANWPANAKLIFESVYQAVYLEYIYDWLFKFSGDRYEQLIESMKKAEMKHGLGIFAVILIILVVLMLIYFLLKI